MKPDSHSPHNSATPPASLAAFSPAAHDPFADVLGTEAARLFGVKSIYPWQRLVMWHILAAAGWYGPEAAADAPSHRIVLLPTGAGKSLCFQLPAMLTEGLTLVVFPILALLSDQERRLASLSLPFAVLRGGQTPQERAELLENIHSGRVKMLLTNPEALQIESIIGQICAQTPIHLVVDEAHCVVQWGDSFRPSYLALSAIARHGLVKSISAFTATASQRITARLRALLFPGCEPHLLQANADRPNIHYRVQPSLCRDRDVFELCTASARPAIVFCATRDNARLGSIDLRRRLEAETCAGLSPDEVFFYHAGLSREEKRVVEQWFHASPNGVLFATCAYGMGVDKPNIRTVIHQEAPQSVEAFLQESGRAGRDGAQSWSVLLAPALSAQKTPSNPVLRALQNTACRREALVTALGGSLEYCSGCDSCDGTSTSLAAGQADILEFFSRRPRRYDPATAARLLSAAPCPGQADLRPSPWFGRLSGWLPDDVNQAISTLITGGLLRTGKKISPWKGLISLKTRQK